MSQALKVVNADPPGTPFPPTGNDIEIEKPDTPGTAFPPAANELPDMQIHLGSQLTHMEPN